MDLGTVTKKLHQDSYHNIEDFDADIPLTFDNSMLYNEMDSTVYDKENELKIVVLRLDGLSRHHSLTCLFEATKHTKNETKMAPKCSQEGSKNSGAPHPWPSWPPRRFSGGGKTHPAAGKDRKYKTGQADKTKKSAKTGKVRFSGSRKTHPAAGKWDI